MSSLSDFSETWLSSNPTSHNSKDDLNSFSNEQNSTKISNQKNFILKSDFFTNSDFSDSHSQPQLSEELKYIESPIVFYYENQEKYLKHYISQKKKFQVFKKNKKDFKKIKIICSEKINEKTDNALLVSIIRTQQGCRYYQNQILKSKRFANKVLYPHIRDFLPDLICDPFGNYLCQDFLDVFNERNVNHFLGVISSNFIEFAFNPFGTRVIQKMVEKAYAREKIGVLIYELLLEKLKGNIVQMAKDENASHIITQSVTLLDEEDISFFYEEIKESFSTVAKSKFGCCVLEKWLLQEKKEQKEEIRRLMIENFQDLIVDKFGNYVCQCFLMNSNEEIITIVYNILYYDIFNFCKGKYSSNVVEKLFEARNLKVINDIACRLIHNERITLDLVCCQYGNYIIQKLLNSLSNEYLKVQLLNIIKKNINMIQRTSFGYKMLTQIEKHFPVVFHT